MTARERRLQRLLAIRRIGEELAQRRLRGVLASVTEAEAALACQQQAIADASKAAAAALNSSNRSDGLFAEAQSEVAGWNRARLMPILESRRALVAPATASFFDRRREHEQVQQLIKESKAQHQVIDDRKAQVAADDWFLAQRTRIRK